jgi:hypothetical protein
MTRALLLFLCTAALPALAFEGVIDTKMTMTGKGDGDVRDGSVTIKGLNFRMDSETKHAAGVTKMTSIARAEEPGVTYILNDQSKTFQKVDSKSDPERDDGSKWTVKRLGKETIAGRTTEHVQLQKDGGSNAMEVWVDTQLVSASDLARPSRRRRRLVEGAGEGGPVRRPTQVRLPRQRREGAGDVGGYQGDREVGAGLGFPGPGRLHRGLRVRDEDGRTAGDEQAHPRTAEATARDDAEAAEVGK